MWFTCDSLIGRTDGHRSSLLLFRCFRNGRILGLTGFDLVLFDLTEFDWVLFDLTEFYWVLFGFTWFYLVVLGFTWFFSI